MNITQCIQETLQVHTELSEKLAAKIDKVGNKHFTKAQLLSMTPFKKQMHNQLLKNNRAKNISAAIRSDRNSPERARYRNAANRSKYMMK